MISKEIEEKYPRLYPDGKQCCFGCPEGWLPLVENLSGNIDFVLKYWVPKDKSINVVVAQVKSKFGGLRFYCDFSYDDEDIDLVKIVEHINGMIYMAESISFTICEDCGNPGKRIGGGWIKTRCEEHKE